MKNKISVIILVLLLAACTGGTFSELQLAAARGQTDMVAVMLDKGADINEMNRNGKTPLMMAAANGHTETVELLLKRHAAIDAKDIDGVTALMMAASSGETNTVAALIKAGASVNVVNAYNSSAVTNAAFFNQVATLDELLKSKEKVKPDIGETALLIASGLGNDKIIQHLLDYGVDCNARGKNGRTPLMAAVEFKHLSTVELLLNHKANPKVMDTEGHSVMSIAENSGNKEIIALLKKNGG